MSIVKALDLSQVKDVKSLLDNNLISSKVIPEAYIQPPKHLPVKHQRASSNLGDTIPVVDLANSKDPDKREDVVRAIGDACEKWGFFQIINHGFNPIVARRMLEGADKFFDLPLEEKMAYYSLDLTKPLRFGTSYNPLKDSSLQWRDYMNIPCKGGDPELAICIPILSNGRYKSIEHRAIVNSMSKRLSLASLYNVAPNAMINPLPDLVDKSHPLAFKEIMFMDFFKKFASQDLDGKNALDCVRIRHAKET